MVFPSVVIFWQTYFEPPIVAGLLVTVNQWLTANCNGAPKAVYAGLIQPQRGPVRLRSPTQRQPMRRIRTALLALLGLPAICLAADPAGADTPYRDFYKQLGVAKAADTANVLRILMCPTPARKEDQLPADLAFEIRDGAERTPLTLDARRCFELPANAAWAEHDASLHKNSTMKFRAVINITGRLPASTQLSYAQLTASVAAFQKIVAAQGMMARMFAPTVKGLEMKFDPATPQSLIVHAPGGDQRYVTDEKGVIRMPVDPALDSARVELSSLPIEIGPDA